MTNDDLPRPPLELLELATGYQRSKTLFAAVDFALPTLLARGPLAVEEIATALEIHPLAADRFLNACVAIGLAEREGRTYRNAPLAETYLVRGGAAYLGDLVARYDRTSYFVWTDLATRLRAWTPGETDATPPTDADQGESSLAAQHNLAVLTGRALADAYDFSAHTTMLDLGGGSGGMSIAVCAARPHMRAVVFDLEGPTRLARSLVEEAGLADRVRVETGDFKEDPLPEGFDVALLANLLSVSSEETNRRLLARVFEALPPGGGVILSGWILDDTHTGPLLPVLFCLEDIVWRAPDVERSASTYARWLVDAGFAHVERVAYSPPWSAVVARKP